VDLTFIGGNLLSLRGKKKETAGSLLQARVFVKRGDVQWQGGLMRFFAARNN
jgi:hypothetical protein